MKRCRILAWISLLYFLAWPAGASAQNSYEDPQSQFAVDLPAGWRLDTFLSKEDKFGFFLPIPAGEGTGNLVITVLPGVSDNALLFSEEKKSATESMSDITPEVDGVDLEVNGYPARWGVYQGKMKSTGQTRFSLVGSVSLAKFGIKFHVTELTPEKKIQWGKEFERTFHSIREAQVAADRLIRAALVGVAEPAKMGEGREPISIPQRLVAYEDFWGRFAVDLPEGWTPQPQGSEQASLFKGTGSESFVMGYAAGVTERGRVLSLAVKDLKGSLRDASPEGQVMDLEVNGRPARWGIYRGQAESGGSKLGFFALLGSVIVDEDEGGVYFVSILDEASKGAWAGLLERVFQSIRPFGARVTGASPAKAIEPAELTSQEVVSGESSPYTSELFSVELPPGWKPDLLELARIKAPPDPAINIFKIGRIQEAVAYFESSLPAHLTVFAYEGKETRKDVLEKATKFLSKRKFPRRKLLLERTLEAEVNRERIDVEIYEIQPKFRWDQPRNAVVAAVKFGERWIAFVGDTLSELVKSALPGMLGIIQSARPPHLGAPGERARAEPAGGENMPATTPDNVIRRRAAKEGKELWRVPLGLALVEEMFFLSPEKLLVGLKKDIPGVPNLDYLLVETASGKVLWRYRRDQKEKADFDFLRAQDDQLIFSVKEGAAGTLLALDAATGAERWSVSFKGDLVNFYLEPATRWILAEESNKDSRTFSAVTPADGRIAWKSEVKVRKTAKAQEKKDKKGKEKEEEATSAPPVPLLASGDVWNFYNGVERLSGNDGRRVWSRGDILVDENSPLPQLEGQELFVVEGGGRLSALDASSGAKLWTAVLPASYRYTNIYPYGERIYVRGQSCCPIQNLVAAVSRRDGKVLWSGTARTGEASLSNFIESDGRLYFGTETALVALDAETGKEVFSWLLPGVGGGRFPIHLRKYPDKIVYIGEWLVAGLDPATGRKIYAHQFTPLSEKLTIKELDFSIMIDQAVMRGAAKGLSSSSGFTGIHGLAINFQNMSNTFHNRAFSQRQLGDGIGAAASTEMAKMNSQFSRIMSTQAAAKAGGQMLATVLIAMQVRKIAGQMARSEVLKDSILSAFPGNETASFAYRPHRKQLSDTKDFMTLSVVHLPTGQRRDTYLSPTYLNYGIWSLVDFERGVVYHHGLGLDPSAYQFGEAHEVKPNLKLRTFESFLVATPIRAPR